MFLRQKIDMNYQNVFIPKDIKKIGGKRLGQRFIGNKKQFSIITVVLNNEKFIEDTIKSVINQNVDFEYIIIDGGSTDKTIDIIKKYENKLDLWISEKDLGIYHAMNKGIIYSNGDFIGIINSGDTYNVNSLGIIKNYIKKNSSIDFIFGAVKKKKLKFGFNKNKINWSFDFYPSHSSGFFLSSEVQKKIGLYNLKYKLSSDYDLFYRLIKGKFFGISTKKEEIIGNFKSGSYSSTFNFDDQFLEEIQIRIDNNQNRIIILFIIVLNFFYSRIRKKKLSLKFFFKLIMLSLKN